MTSFTYNVVPISSDNPSADQPLMLQNTNSNISWAAVDHVGFNSGGSGGAGSSGGQHLQVAFNSKNTPAAPVDPISVLFTANGTSSTVAQLKFVNSNVTFPLNALVAYGVGTSAGITQSFNINAGAFVKLGVGQYQITLTPNATTGTTFGVNVTAVSNSSTVSIIANYIITGANVFVLRFNAVSASTLNPADPTFYTFTVYQI